MNILEEINNKNYVSYSRMSKPPNIVLLSSDRSKELLEYLDKLFIIYNNELSSINTNDLKITCNQGNILEVIIVKNKINYIKVLWEEL